MSSTVRERSGVRRPAASSEFLLCRAHLLCAGFHQAICVIALRGCEGKKELRFNVVQCRAAESAILVSATQENNYRSGLMFYAKKA